MMKSAQKITLKFMACLLAVFHAGSVSGAVLCVATNGAHVPPYGTWVDAATNIQTAVEAASDGDLVMVGAGRYVVSQPVTMTNGITLISRHGAAATEVNGNNSSRCFTIKHSGAVLEGFTITAGSAASGGGILITNGLVHNCVITGNYAQLFGGGVYIQNAGTVSRCVISSNRAPINAGGCGGGACVIGDGSSGARLAFSTVSGNEAASGGGIYLFENAVVENCNIVSNRAWDAIGWGVGSGGGVECNGRNITVKNCLIAHNLSQETAGGVYLSGHTGQKVVGCLLYDNETAKYGGGLYVNLAPDAYAIESCTIVSNRAVNAVVGVGGGICSGSGQALSFRNSIIYFNTAGSAGNNYHVVDGGVDSGQNNCTTPTLAGTGNITGDPRFYSAAAANFRLATNSPCIDSGTNQDWMISARDIDGNARILNSVVDMGAYERDPNGDSETAYNDIVLRVISPVDDESLTAPAPVYCDMRAEQEWWGGGITQTVATLDGAESNRQAWNNERYCMIQFTLANVAAGDHVLILRSWDAQNAMVSTAKFFSVSSAPASRHYFMAADFDGDRLADTAYYHEAIGWYANFSSLQYPGYTFGPVAFYRTDYLPLSGDFDGDGLIDLVLYNDAGGWIFKLSSHGYNDESGPETFHAEDFKLPGMIPLAADFDGDARADMALYSEGSGWCFKLSSRGYIGEAGAETFNASDFKLPGTAPLAADFDGDRLADLGLYNEADGWYMKLSSQGYQGIVGPVAFVISGGGAAFDSTAGDFDGDGLADPTVVSQSGVWYVWMSSAAYLHCGPFNIPAP